MLVRLNGSLDLIYCVFFSFQVLRYSAKLIIGQVHVLPLSLPTRFSTSLLPTPCVCSEHSGPNTQKEGLYLLFPLKCNTQDLMSPTDKHFIVNVISSDVAFPPSVTSHVKHRTLLTCGKPLGGAVKFGVLPLFV